MAEKRKDSKGRVLKTGESERADGRYQYRFTQGTKRHTIYANTLKELREKEDEVQTAISRGTDYAKANITVSELCDLYLSQKPNIRCTSMQNYQTAIRYIQNSSIGCLKIDKVLVSDVKRWCIEQSKRYKPNTVRRRLSVLHQAFQMAFEDKVVLSNPCNFDLGSVINFDSKEKEALTRQQLSCFILALQEHRTASRLSRMATVLIHTGIRIGECLAITKDDVDFEKRCLTINKQVIYYKRHLYISTTKTHAGQRIIPLDKEALKAFADEMSIHPPTNSTYDGYSGIIFYTNTGLIHPCVITKMFCTAVQRYNEQHPQEQNKLPHITPHLLRHTFCSLMAERRMPIKVLQYIMGHSNPEVTLRVYTHVSTQWVNDTFKQITDENLTPLLTPMNLPFAEKYAEICNTRYDDIM